MIQKETRSNCEKYKKLWKNANNICKKKKKDMYKRKLEEIEELSRQNETRKFYAAINKIKDINPKKWDAKIGMVK
jgi:hypothetical protein